MERAYLCLNGVFRALKYPLRTRFSDIVVAVELALIAPVAYVLVSEAGAGGVGGVVEGHRVSQPGW